MDDSNTKTMLFLDGALNDKRGLENLMIAQVAGAKIYLKDVASIGYGPIDLNSFVRFSDKDSSKAAVLLGVAKMKGSNAVNVVGDVLKKVNEMRQKLPKNAEIRIIQNEGETARKATNELMFHLFVSIFIVLVILIIFLGVKNALNAAFCIPMVLGIVFIV